MPILMPISPPPTDVSWQPIWRETVGLLNSGAEAYLLARLGKLPGDLEDLRFHPRCPRGGHRLPAMVALMRDAISNVPTGIHRTYLARRPDGTWSKADVEPVKMMLGRATGSVVTAMAPARVTITEITAAKIGRSMKNFAIALTLLLSD